jgi:hypothetical protein
MAARLAAYETTLLVSPIAMCRNMVSKLVSLTKQNPLPAEQVYWIHF